MNAKLFVGNLSFETTENDLHDLFGAYGTVTEVNLVMDKMSGRSRGFAFVTLSSAEQAQAAMEGLNGKDVNGRALSVSEARPQEQRTARSGGGGYRGAGAGGGRGARHEKRY